MYHCNSYNSTYAGIMEYTIVLLIVIATLSAAFKVMSASAIEYEIKAIVHAKRKSTNMVRERTEYSGSHKGP